MATDGWGGVEQVGLTFGSLFSGAGGFDIGFHRAGFACAWQVEIDKTARSVLARHWPDVSRHEDVRDVGRHNLTPVDVLIGGFPCQDLSVAGKQAGLGGERSGLFYELARICFELRPRFLVWENVPGLLSSGGGRDFARVLGHLGDGGYFGAWRVLDAQHFGVPQRRRRVFGVFAPGRAGVGRCAQVLALAEGLRRDSPKGEQARAGLAPSVTPGARRASGNRGGELMTVAHTIRTKEGHGAERGDGCDNLVVAAYSELGQGHVTYQPTDIATALRINTGGGSQVANLCVTGETTHALTAIGADASEDGTGRGTPIVAQCHGSNVGGMGTLRRGNGNITGGVPFVMNWNATDPAESSELCPNSRAQEGCGSGMPATQFAGTARRLTPRECERLMGWPDDWTRYREDGTEIADGPRYRLCGNGVVGTVAEWIGRRLVRVRTGD